MVEAHVRAMTKAEQYAFKCGSNDFRENLEADQTRHHFRTVEERDAYIRGFQLAIGGSENGD